MKKIILLLLSVNFAAFGLENGAVTNQKLCQDFFSRSIKGELFKQWFMRAFLHRVFSINDFHTYNFDNPEEYDKKIDFQEKTGENVIITIGLPSKMSEKEKEFKRKIQIEQKKLANAFSSLTISSCTKKLNKIRFQWSAFSKLEKEYFSVNQNYARSIKRIIKFSENRLLHLNWRVLWGLDMGQILTKLQDPKIKNILFVLHGNSQGILFDAYNNPLPKNFFELVHPGLYSLAFFNCHCQETLKYYNIHEIMKKSNDFNQRKVFTVKVRTIAGISGVVPINELGLFIQSINYSLKKNSVYENRNKQDLIDSCYIEVDQNFNQWMALELNRKTLGLTNRAGKNRYKINCSLIEAKNIIILTPRPTKDFIGALTIPELHIYRVDGTQIDTHVEHFANSSGVIIKSKWTF